MQKVSHQLIAVEDYSVGTKINVGPTIANKEIRFVPSLKKLEK